MVKMFSLFLIFFLSNPVSIETSWHHSSKDVQTPLWQGITSYYLDEIYLEEKVES